MAIISNRHCFYKTVDDVALILVNTPASFPILDRVWKNATVRIVADGAANRLLHCLQEEQERRNTKDNSFFDDYLPNFITGDLDSISAETRSFYEGKNVPIIKDPSQDSTDLMKCLTIVDKYQEEKGIRFRVIVLGAFGGRFDQEMQNLNALYLYENSYKQITMLSDCCLASLIPRGKNIIHCAWPFEGPTCGLIPLGCPVEAMTTSGLRWDVTDWDSRFGGRISSSNHIEGHLPWTSSDFASSVEETIDGVARDQYTMEVHVEVTQPIVWTVIVDPIPFAQFQ